MAEAGRIHDLDPIIEEKVSCGERKKEMAAREEETKAPGTSTLMQCVDRLVQFAEEDEQMQIMTQKILRSKLEETSILAELAASKMLAQREALKALELEQRLAVMTDNWIQQVHVNDDLQEKIERLEAERDLLLRQMSSSVKKRTPRSVAKSISKYLLPAHRTREEETMHPVAVQDKLGPEVPPVKRQEKRKTGGFKWKSFLCCFSY